MRATKGYVAGVGTTSALVGAIGCAFAVMSAVVAVHGWPLTLAPPGVTTVEGGTAGGADLLPPALDVFTGSGASASPRAHAGRRATERPHGVRTHSAGGPVASAFGRAVPLRGSARTGVRAPRPGASAASPPPSGGGGSGPTQPGGGGTAGGSTTPTGSGSGGTPTLAGTVTQVASGAGTAVAQTGQQLSGAVQGTTGQLGGAVGQVSPAAGQVVTQTGQVVGGVVSGATGTAGQVVSGAGAAVGDVLGGLTGGRTTR